MKGAIKVEFIFGVVIFVIIILYSASQINTMFLVGSSDSKIDTEKLKTSTTLDFIVNKYDINDFDCGDLAQYELGQYRFTIDTPPGESEPIICGSRNVLPSNIFELKYVSFEDGSYGRVTLELW